MFSRIGFYRPAFALFALLWLSGCAPAPELQVTDASIRDLIPGRDTTAGYFTLRNNTNAAVTLIGATSEHARAIEMHRTYIKEDRVRMQRVPEQVIGPGELVQFAPGGLHLMIFGVTSMPEPFNVTLQFKSGRQVDAAFSKLSN